MSIAFEALSEALRSIAPWEYAAEWDNVGELILPFARTTGVSTALLTIDLTQAVVDEAAAGGANVVVAYHPPIFKPLKHVRIDDAATGVAARCMVEGVAVLSPHTALDAAAGGVNDWLAGRLGPGEARPIERPAPAGGLYKVVVFVPADDADALRAALSDAGAGVIGDYSQCSYSVGGEGTFLGGATTNPAVGERGRLERVAELRMEMVCHASDLPAVREAVDARHPYEEPAWDVVPLVEPAPAGVGQGRLVTLDNAVGFETLVERIKSELGLAAARVATPPGWPRDRAVRTVALCPGAGGSVVAQTGAEVYLTGEMRHHDVLAANARGSAVVLTEHTNCERGYLPELKRRLEAACGDGVAISVSQVDADPLRTV